MSSWVPVGIAVVLIGVFIAGVGMASSARGRPFAFTYAEVGPGGPIDSWLRVRGRDVSLVDGLLEVRDGAGEVVARIEMLEGEQRQRLLGTSWIKEPDIAESAS